MTVIHQHGDFDRKAGIGLVAGMPEAVYHHGGPDDECSFHLAMTLMRTPSHARYAMDHPDTTDTTSKKFGRAMHAAILQPERYDEMVVAMPEGQARRGKWWTEFQAEHEGKDIITFAEQERIDDITMRLQTHVRRAGESVPSLAQVLLNPDDMITELSGFFIDPDTGLRCRIRIDAWNMAHAMLVDVKSSSDNDLHTLGRRFADYHYAGQQAWYTDGAEVLGLEVKHFVFVLIESDFPHTIRVVTCNPRQVEEARHINRVARTRWKGCMDEGYWPGWPDEVEVVELPPWAGRMPA